MSAESYVEKFKERWKTWSIMHWLFGFGGSTLLTAAFSVISQNLWTLAAVFGGFAAMVTAWIALRDKDRQEAEDRKRQEVERQLQAARQSLLRIRRSIPNLGTGGFSAVFVDVLAAAAAKGEERAPKDWRNDTHAALVTFISADLAARYREIVSADRPEHAAAAFLDHLAEHLKPSMLLATE